jgi:hypothetical protein
MRGKDAAISISHRLRAGSPSAEGSSAAGGGTVPGTVS